MVLSGAISDGAIEETLRTNGGGMGVCWVT